MAEDSPTPGGNEPGLLDGWKAIAAYLGKSVRTAQRYHRELGLPVYHRRGIDTEGVYAQRSDIDAWQTSSAARAATSSLGTPPPEGPGAKSIPVDRWFRPSGPSTLALSGVLVLGVAIVVLVTYHYRTLIIVDASIQPAKYQVVVNELRVFNTDGNLLWVHQFPAPLVETIYRARADSRRVDAGRIGDTEPASRRMPSVEIGDIDGDGDSEVLVVAHYMQAPAELLCFDRTGGVRWTYKPKQTQFFGGENTGVPERINWVCLERDPRPSQRHTIWLESQHVTEFPTLVERLDPKGRVTGSYWSNGHITSLTFGTVRGRFLAFLGGANNEHLGASLAVLDPRGPDASAPAEDPAYRCASCPSAPPEHFIVFPATRLCGVDGGMATVSAVAVSQSGQIFVNVLHHTEQLSGRRVESSAETLYELSADFDLLDARFDAQYRTMHQHFEGLGLLRHAFAEETHRNQMFPVLRWNGRGFVEMPPVRPPRL